MNWKTFTALLARDAHVARRNIITLVLQTMLQPLLFVFIFGQVMIRSGMLTATYKAILLSGIMATTMLMSGIMAVSMPLITEFLTKEIEDRLLAPMDMKWLAVEKVVAGTVQSLVAGLIVLPAAWLILGKNVEITFDHPALFLVMMLLVAVLASSAGMAMGSSVGQQHIGLLFSMVLAPMVMFGCAYYPWHALKDFKVLKIAVLINPMVYASEGLRGTLAPAYIPHMPFRVVLTALAALDVALIAFGMNRFRKKAMS